MHQAVHRAVHARSAGLRLGATRGYGDSRSYALKTAKHSGSTLQSGAREDRGYAGWVCFLGTIFYTQSASFNAAVHARTLHGEAPRIPRLGRPARTRRLDGVAAARRKIDDVTNNAMDNTIDDANRDACSENKRELSPRRRWRW